MYIKRRDSRESGRKKVSSISGRVDALGTIKDRRRIKVV